MGDLVVADVDGQTLLGRVESVVDGALQDGQSVYDVAFERMTLHGMLDSELAPATSEQVGAVLLGLQSGEGLLGMMGQVADGTPGQATDEAAGQANAPQVDLGGRAKVAHGQTELLRDAYLRSRYLELLGETALRPSASGESSGESNHVDDSSASISSDVLSQVEPWEGLPAKGARVRFAVGAGGAADMHVSTDSARSAIPHPVSPYFYGVMDGAWESPAGERFASVKVLGGTCLVPPEQLEACPESQSQSARFAVGERARYVSEGHADDPEFEGTVVSVALRPTNEWAYDLQFDDGYTLEQLGADELVKA
ncbi:MAG: hypothetical protein ACI4B6_06655 [Atopobiaceae bacterium]